MARTTARRVLAMIGWSAALLLAQAPVAAYANLAFCNRTSYLLDIAFGLESKGAAATRGWFRIDPGQCRTVLQGEMDDSRVYLHARPAPVYRHPPLTQARPLELCVADGDFVIAGARQCPAPGQRLAAFSEVKPSAQEDGFAAYIAEEAEYSAEQARLAGIQRLLVAAGYDAEPIDGIEGRKTEAALAQFLKDQRLAAAADGPALFDALLAAARRAGAAALSWCNETAHTVMAALGADEGNGIVTRGWYRIAPGQCRQPDVAARARVYSFAEAVDEENRVIRRGNQPLAWGGPVMLCTREQSFEIAEQKQCAERGLLTTGFATVELTKGGATVRFRE